MKNFQLLGSVALLTAASSCAVSMKMQGNRFESSEVYGKTAFRLKTGYAGQSDVQLTDDFTLVPPNTANPLVEPTHELIVGGSLGIQDRLEIGLDTNSVGKAKLQILGEPKIRAGEGNLSLAVVGTFGYRSWDKSDTGLFSTQEYKSHIENTTYGGQLVVGYRPDPILNLYAGPFIERGTYNGSYEVVNVSKSNYDGKGLNKGAVIGLEIGSPRVTGMLEAAWNHTNSAGSKASFWVGGAQIIVSFGSTKESSASESRTSSGGYDGRSGF